MAIADEPGVDAGLFFAEVKNELMLDVTEEEDETEETLSTELIELVVADRRGIGMGGRLFIVEPSQTTCRSWAVAEGEGTPQAQGPSPWTRCSSCRQSTRAPKACSPPRSPRSSENRRPLCPVR